MRPVLEFGLGGYGEAAAEAEGFGGDFDSGGGLLALVFAAFDHANDAADEIGIEIVDAGDLVDGRRFFDKVFENGVEDVVGRERIGIFLVGA